MSFEFEIKPPSKFSIAFKELAEYKELFYFFTWRDVKVKYKQTILGFLWAILQPLFMTTIFALFLGDSITQKTRLNIPYPVFALSGMLLWGIFSGGISGAANSMINNANIIKKIYFPRLIIPISSILVTVVDFFIGLIIFVFIVYIYNVDINYLCILFLPLSLLITCLSTIGVGTFLAAINIKYRDVKYIIPFLVQGLLFLTPVLYPINISSNSKIYFLMKLNPMSGALELIRSIFTGYVVDIHVIILSLSSSVLLFILGVIYFKKTESYFADLA